MTYPGENTGIIKLKKFVLTLGFIFLGIAILSIMLKGCLSGCSLGKRVGISRSYKQGFPIRLIKGQPSAVYKAMKEYTKYRIVANKPFYAMDADEDLYEREAGCAIWISGSGPTWLVVQARYDGTIIEKVEEGSCKNK